MSGAAGIAVSAAGQIMGDIGSIMSANEASRKKKNLKRLIENMPPIDVNGLTGESLTQAETNQPRVQGLERSQNTFNLAEMQRMMRESVPGYDQLMAGESNTIQSYLKGEIPADVAAQVTRRSAGRALMGGYAGSGMHQNLTARDLGLTSLDLTNRGLEQARQFRSSVRLPTLANFSSYLGLTPEQLITLRSRERTEYLNNMMAVEGMPTYNDVIGGRLISAGDRLAGSGGGMGGMSFGGGGQSAGTNTSGAQNSTGYDWMAGYR